MHGFALISSEYATCSSQRACFSSCVLGSEPPAKHSTVYPTNCRSASKFFFFAWTSPNHAKSSLQKSIKVEGEVAGPLTTSQGDVGNSGGGGGGGGGDDDDGGGLSWLTKAAGAPKPVTTAPTGASPAVEGGLDPGIDWLAAATSSSQTKQKPRAAASTAKATPAPAAPGGWMSSGKLGISTEEDSDRDDAGKAGAGGSAASTAAAAKPRKKKQPRVSVSVASGPEGWLGSGALGVPTQDESDDDEGDSGDGKGVVLATIETQTEDDIEAVTERGAIEKGGGRQLPPWAKPWTPPPKPQAVPDPSPEETSAPSGETNKKVRSSENSPDVEDGPRRLLAELSNPTSVQWMSVLHICRRG